MNVILFGASRLLDYVEIEMRRDGRYPILRLSPPHVPKSLDALTPGIIIYDQQMVSPAFASRLVVNAPGWLLLGLIESDGCSALGDGEGNGRVVEAVTAVLQHYQEMPMN